MPFPERDNAAMRHTARLHPNRRGDRYSVIFNDELIVSRSRDPECDAARALLAKGITGKLVMLDGKTRKPRTIIDIEEAAKLCVKEGPLRFAPFNESRPDRSSTPKAKFSDRMGSQAVFWGCGGPLEEGGGLAQAFSQLCVEKRGRVPHRCCRKAVSLMSMPPSKGKFWQALAAVNVLPVNSPQKAVLGCLVHHANPGNGLCYPSEALIAAEIKKPLRTVERAVSGLLTTPYVSRSRRPQSSNSYVINFEALLREFAAFKARGEEYRNAREATRRNGSGGLGGAFLWPVKSGGSPRQEWRV
jgi:hypothetical protein